MPKRGYHHGNLRQALIDGALKLIEEMGVEVSDKVITALSSGAEAVNLEGTLSGECTFSNHSTLS